MAEDLADLADFMKGLPDIVNTFAGNIEDMEADIRKSLGTYSEGTQRLFGEIKIDGDGKNITATDGDRTWSVTDAVDSYNKGDFTDSFREILGDDALKDPKVQEQIKSLQTAQDATPMGQDRIAQEKFTQNAQEAAKKLPKTGELFKDGKIPTKAQLFDALKADGVDTTDLQKMGDTVEDIQKKLKDGTLRSVKDVEEEIKKKMGGDSKLKTFFERLLKVLTLAAIAACIFLATEFVMFLKEVQNAMNGCWSSTQEGKCKIDVLTCNKDDMSQAKNIVFGDGGKGFAVCDFATDSTGKHSKSGSNLLFIPLLSGQSCSCNLDSKGQPIIPLDTSDWNSQGTNTDCSGASAKNPKCPITIQRATATSGTPACKNTSGCITDSGACATTMNSQCSSWCDSKVLLTTSGQTISCVDVSMMDVLGNLLQDALPSGFLGTMETVLFWAAVGIVGILVLGFIWKEVAYLTEGGGTGGENSHTIYVKTDNPASAELSFGRRKKH